MVITNLEKFVEREIVNPYINSRTISTKITLDNAKEILIKDKKWSKLVLRRLFNMDIKFAKYIQHPLVSFLQNAMTIDWNKNYNINVDKDILIISRNIKHCACGKYLEDGEICLDCRNRRISI